jgi:hypothetical protein
MRIRRINLKLVSFLGGLKRTEIKISIVTLIKPSNVHEKVINSMFRQKVGKEVLLNSDAKSIFKYITSKLVITLHKPTRKKLAKCKSLST